MAKKRYIYLLSFINFIKWEYFIYTKNTKYGIEKYLPKNINNNINKNLGLNNEKITNSFTSIKFKNGIVKLSCLINSGNR